MGFRFKKEYSDEKSADASSVFNLDFKNFYQLNHKNLSFAKRDAIVLHPGPVNRNLEISSELMDDSKYSKIFDQVEYGLTMRKAIIEFLFNFNK